MISFFEAANTLEYLCEQIDSGIEIDHSLREAFAEHQDNLEKQVDRRISYIKYCQAQINTANEMKSKWNERMVHFQRILEKIKEDTHMCLKAHPHLPYRGTLGRFKIYKNASPLLKIDDHKIDAIKEYYYEKTEQILDRQRLVEDLKQGKEVAGATLEYGDHLRILIQ